MDYSRNRSAAVTVAAVLAILGSLFLLLCCAVVFFGMLLVKLPSATPEVPPFMRNTLLATQGLMMCLSLFGMATGIGLFYLRHWARISVLIWGGVSVFVGLLGITIVLLMSFVYGLPLLIGIWWLVLFNRQTVKTQFGGPTVAVAVDLPQKPACPLAISVLAWFYITSILNLLFLPFLPFRVPIFVFGRVLPGRVGLTVLILSFLAFFLAGIGLLKLKPWSYSLTLGLQLFWLASTVVTVLSPNYNSAMDSFMKEMQATLHLPETQFSPANFSHHYGWTVVLAFLFAGAILGLLVYYRPRFLAAASRAASLS
ncbi:MAG: hypothetical protein DMG51_13510 [Acidobacteria bacterium]|nr:MAG: hypothetical protein DMG51_13510 [Acidobacteriota bacterium]